MKLKNILKTAFLTTTLMANAQTNYNTVLPKEKSLMYELNFDPMGSKGVFSFDNMQVKYWMNKEIVFRLGLGINTRKNELANGDFNNDEQYKSNLLERTSSYTIKPGIEFRLLKNSKISPYIGFELQYKNKTSSANYKEYSKTATSYNSQTGQYDYTYEFRETKIDNGWRSYDSYYYTSNGSTYTGYSLSYAGERAYSSIGGNLLFGSDFYLLKNVFFGFEVGLGYNSVQYKLVTVDISTSVKKQYIPGFSTNELAFYYNSAIRFGVWF